MTVLRKFIKFANALQRLFIILPHYAQKQIQIPKREDMHFYMSHIMQKRVVALVKHSQVTYQCYGVSSLTVFNRKYSDSLTG